MSSPSIPDPNRAAQQGAIAGAENFPFEYIINQLAQLGGNATVNGQNFDFTGLGTADNAGAMSDQMAKALLDIQKNYGADFVKQRLADLQQADPQGFADRKQLFDKILADSQKAAPVAQMSQDLQDEVNKQLNTGGQLTTGPGGELEQVQQSVRGGQIARGITLGNAPAEQEAAAVEGASEQKRNQVQNAAQQYIAAGVSPEDIQYRQIQQSLANLGAFETGTTPEAQFGSLSGAGNGAAPFTAPYSNSANIDPSSSLAQAMQLYSGQVNWAQSQANPWTAGLSVLGGVGNVAAGLGWRPFAPTPTANPFLSQPASNPFASGPVYTVGGDQVHP